METDRRTPKISTKRYVDVHEGGGGDPRQRTAAPNNRFGRVGHLIRLVFRWEAIRNQMFCCFEPPLEPHFSALQTAVFLSKQLDYICIRHRKYKNSKAIAAADAFIVSMLLLPLDRGGFMWDSKNIQPGPSVPPLHGHERYAMFEGDLRTTCNSFLALPFPSLVGKAKQNQCSNTQRTPWLHDVGGVDTSTHQRRRTRDSSPHAN